MLRTRNLSKFSATSDVRYWVNQVRRCSAWLTDVKEKQARIPPHYTAIRYDTIRYGIFTCVQKLKKWPAFLAHGTETRNKEKLKTKNRVAQKKRSG